MTTTAAIPAQLMVEVPRRIREWAGRSAASEDAADRAMAEAVLGFLDRIAARGSQAAVDGIIALPLLVHGAETGDPRPALPAAQSHLLWWASARYLDDLTDAVDMPAAPQANRGILTSIAICSHLCVDILDVAAADDLPRALRLRQEVSRSLLRAVSGQLTDMTADPFTATLDEVVGSYRGKTGAPYAMSAAAGAVLAGCDDARVGAWRAFGERFGVLRQIVNDQRDLTTGRHEDLRNGTATYLITQYLRSLTGEQYDTAIKQLAACADSPEARTSLAARLTAPEQLRGYAASLSPLIARLHEDVEEFGGVPRFSGGLHELVDDTVGLFPEFLLGSVC